MLGGGLIWTAGKSRTCGSRRTSGSSRELVGQAVEPAGSWDCQSQEYRDGDLPCRAGCRACRFLGLSVPRTSRTSQAPCTSGHFGGLESPPNRQAEKPALHPPTSDRRRLILPSGCRRTKTRERDIQDHPLLRYECPPLLIAPREQAGLVIPPRATKTRQQTMDDTTTLCRLDAKYLTPRIPADEASASSPTISGATR
jgi:hypothetical protein